ncbi:helix-turn-helix domain-containing protein [Pseudomonas sp. FSL W5-0299]|uniref:helix-turn-helix domain-containing protein n=1 Tax=Pseudomonas sp. FSL W5-0299 TaxID=1917484 RepID=UPI00098AF19C|nr:helix-turn-helix transcriptional regulator [Pseudomonas sp. FSL W5-0299]OOL39352.1 transcriptional regulator [Pseudomonas sp. FSL W5-0299]
MAIQFFDSPFHVTHDEEVASKMALKMELSIFITDCIKKLGLKQSEAAARLNVTQSRVSEFTTGKIEKFTIDAMMDMLDKLGFRTTFTLPSNDAAALPQIVITSSYPLDVFDNTKIKRGQKPTN